MGMTKSAVCLYDPERRELAIEAAVGLTDEEPRSGWYRLGEGMTDKVTRSGLPIVIPDIGREPHVLNNIRARDLHGVAFICLPIKIHRKILGVLSVERPSLKMRAPMDADLQVLTIMTSLIGPLPYSSARNRRATSTH